MSIKKDNKTETGEKVQISQGQKNEVQESPEHEQSEFKLETDIFSKFQSWKEKEVRPPEKNLGKRVFQEMAGNQTFYEDKTTGLLMPWYSQNQILPERATYAKTAKLLGLSKYAVKRICIAYEKGGEEEVSKLQWGKGRPTKNLFLKQEEIDYMVSKMTLNRQVGMSLKAKAEEFSLRFKRFYQGRGITQQFPQVRLGPVNLGSPYEQQERINWLQKDINIAIKEEREIICIDECIFNSKYAKRPQWAPIGKPLEYDRRYFPDKYVAVCAATSNLRGLIHYELLHKEAFTKKSFMKFFKKFYSKCRKLQDIAVLLDNCKIHESNDFEKYCDKNDIMIIWNVKYRPDFNGIEFVWGMAKRKFRTQLDWYKANGQQWNEMQLVEQILISMEKEDVIKSTQKGFTNIQEAKPVFPQRFVDNQNRQPRFGNLIKIMKPQAKIEDEYKNHRAQLIEKINNQSFSDEEDLDEVEHIIENQEELDSMDEAINEAEEKGSSSYSESEEK